MNCKDCPYIGNELQKIIADCQSHVKCSSELYQYIEIQYIIETRYMDCFCKKIGSCLNACNEHCDNIYHAASQIKVRTKKSKKFSKKAKNDSRIQNRYANNTRFHSKKKRGYQRRQYLRTQKQLQQLWRIVRYPYPVIYVDTVKMNGEFCSREVPYYRREWENHGGKGRRYCKKMSNRHVRYYKGGISKGGNYRKIYDYQWTLQ